MTDDDEMKKLVAMPDDDDFDQKITAIFDRHFAGGGNLRQAFEMILRSAKAHGLMPTAEAERLLTLPDDQLLAEIRKGARHLVQRIQ